VKEPYGKNKNKNKQLISPN